MTTDPRLVQPDRVVDAAASACGDEHRYWCAKRITATALLGVAVLAAAGAIRRRLR